MELHEITTRLVALHAAYVQKLGGQPWIEPNIALHQNGNVYMHLYPVRVAAEPVITIKETSFEGLFTKAETYIAAMPTTDDRIMRHHMSLLAAVVDHGTEHSIPDEYVEPARIVIKAMTDNLLTDQRQTA